MYQIKIGFIVILDSAGDSTKFSLVLMTGPELISACRQARDINFPVAVFTFTVSPGAKYSGT